MRIIYVDGSCNNNGFFPNKGGFGAVILDENENFVCVEGARRVSNVKVLNKTTGKYEPIQLSKTYKLASHNYLLLDGGSGATMLKNVNVIVNDGMLDVEMLELYIVEHLGGVIGQEYADSQGRITIGKVVEQQCSAEVHTEKKSPQTGDTSCLWLWCIVVCAGGMATYSEWERKML